MTGGYYADVEAECQLFHVCVQVSDYEVRQYISIYIYLSSSLFILALLLYNVYPSL